MDVKITETRTENGEHTEISISGERKPRTSGCMKVLGFLCFLVFLGAILKACA